MEDLSLNQITSITASYRNVARSLNAYQVIHWPEFSVEQHVDLNAYQSSLLNRAQDMQTMAVRPAFANTRDLTTRIERATELAESSLTKIEDLTIALNVGAVTVALASYVARADLRGIQIAIQELGELVQIGKESKQ